MDTVTDVVPVFITVEVADWYFQLAFAYYQQVKTKVSKEERATMLRKLSMLKAATLDAKEAQYRLDLDKGRKEGSK